MAEDDRPQIYLITPPDPDTSAFPDRLAAVLDATPVACLRLDLASRDADHVARVADAVRTVAHERDVPMVIADHLRLVRPHGLDGIHLSTGPKAVRDARKELGADAIIGAWCGTSRHDGMNAGEAGADYISFGPVDPGTLGTDPPATPELFAWWSEMIELPCVAEGGLSPVQISALAPLTDFFAVGPEVWDQEDPAAALREIDWLLG